MAAAGRGDAGADPASNPGTVAVCFCESTPLLWRAGDVRTARQTGVVGTLMGSLARQPRQNCRLGRPLELLREEARLLADAGRAVLLSSSRPKSTGAANPELVKQHQEQMDQSYSEQSQLAQQDKKAVLLRVMADKKQGSNQSDQALQERLLALDHGFTFPRTAMAVQLSTARAGMSYGPEELRFLAADSLSPRDERQEARYRVFRDLRRRGFYLTTGGKFGGDYLVYPGDPLRFHAHFIAICLPMDEALSLCDLLALSRLGANVKKTVLLCSPGAEPEEVLYTSLQWSGMV
ncbi:tRNA-splicing endonuclease subunit Sen34 isoform X1 [Paramormyrops kingsleyae]|uniref:tRNA-splicing endonuclease subunit Sen34 isoform X1 n=1 Tax=Paramormyrops kingsleyae TaxID=1676925 RepID=UPI003B96FE2B